MSKISSKLKHEFAMKSVKNDRFVRANGDEGNKLMASSEAIGEQETFRLIDLGKLVQSGIPLIHDDVYALEAYNNGYVSVGDGDELIANQGWIKDWEKFIIYHDEDMVPNHFFMISLKNRNHVKMDFSLDAHLRANGDEKTAEAWEEFVFYEI